MKCSIEAHGTNPSTATKVVYDSDAQPYMYLCPACAEAFEEGQDVFDLAIEDIKEDDSEELPQGK